MENSLQGLDNGIHPLLRLDSRRRMRSPDDALAAPEVDVNDGAAAPNCLLGLGQVKSKVLVHALERRRPADDDDVGVVEFDLSPKSLNIVQPPPTGIPSASKSSYGSFKIHKSCLVTI